MLKVPEFSSGGSEEPLRVFSVVRPPGGETASRVVKEGHDGRAVVAAGHRPAVRELAEENDWLIWQLSDSAFPTGGFAHSGGLEAAWQHGEVRNRVELAGFLEASLHQLGHAALPFVTAVHREPERLIELDRLCEAFTSNHVANRASRLQGQALLSSAERIFATPALGRLRREPACQPPFGHLAPVFGAVTSALGVGWDASVRLFFFTQLRTWTGSAVRLGIVGPLEGAALQHQFGRRAAEVLGQCAGLGVEDIAQTSPLLELWQGTQDRLYSRLFQS